jgi:hypothetical protein
MEKRSDVDLTEIIGMPQLVDSSYFYEQALTRKQVVGNYLNNLNMFEQESTNEVAASLRNDERPLASTVVLIPVAAHQEAHNIANAVAQYAHQDTDKPFSVLLHPNAPADSDWMAAYGTYLEIQKAAKEYPHLDLRWTAPEFYDNPKIGAIRRTLWNAALLLAHVEGAFDRPGDEVIGLNHDIDVVRMSPRYIRRVQRRRDAMQRQYDQLGIPETISTPSSTFVKHAYDPKLPNASKAAFWSDFVLYQTRPKVGYEGGLVVPFSRYAKVGGIAADAVIYETKAFTDGRVPHLIPGTVLETSPRRYAQRLQETNSLDRIWTEKSFGADDVCRSPNQLSDITRHQLEAAVRSTLHGSIDYFFYNPTIQYTKKYDLETRLAPGGKDSLLNEFTQALERKKKLAMTVLTRVMDMPVFADIIDRRFDTNAIAEKTLTNNFDLFIK